MEIEKKLFTSEFIDKLIERISDKVAEKIAEYIYNTMFKKDYADNPGIINPVNPVPFDYPPKRNPEEMIVCMYGVVQTDYQNISEFSGDIFTSSSNASYTDATSSKQNTNPT